MVTELKKETNNIIQWKINRSILLEWSVHIEKRWVEEANTNQSLIVKSFGFHDRVWTFSAVMDRHLSICPGQDLSRSW